MFFVAHSPDPCHPRSSAAKLSSPRLHPNYPPSHDHPSLPLLPTVQSATPPSGLLVPRGPIRLRASCTLILLLARQPAFKLEVLLTCPRQVAPLSIPNSCPLTTYNYPLLPTKLLAPRITANMTPAFPTADLALLCVPGTLPGPYRRSDGAPCAFLLESEPDCEQALANSRAWQSPASPCSPAPAAAWSPPAATSMACAISSRASIRWPCSGSTRR